MTYTAQKKQLLNDTKSYVLQATGMSHDDLCLLIYNTGLAFAEHFFQACPQPYELVQALTANKSYWDWFRYRFHTDDAALITTGHLAAASPATYQAMKEAMIGYELLENELTNYLKSI